MKKFLLVALSLVRCSSVGFALTLRGTTTVSTTTTTPTVTTAVTNTNDIAILNARLDALEKKNKELTAGLKKANETITKLQKDSDKLAKLIADFGVFKLLFNGLDKGLTELKTKFANHTHNLTIFKGTAEQISNEAKATDKNGQVLYLYTTSNSLQKQGSIKTATPNQ
ncbi:MAG: hypothetical protein WC004_04860 [Candidatus Absconditabacterales bacterium]